MNLKTLLFALVLFVPLASAAWQSVAAMSFMIAAILLATVYGIAIGIQSEELKALAKEEFFQLLALLIMMVVLVGTDGLLSEISKSSALTNGQPTIQDAAIVSLNGTQETLGDYLKNISDSDKNVSKEASKTKSCNLAGGGYSVSACGGFTMFNAPFSLSGSIVGYAIAEVASAKKLIELSKDFVISLLLPLGIILRTFRFSRGAGGFLIAFSISAYILLPAGIIFVDMLNEQFSTSPAATDYNGSPQAISANCDSGRPYFSSNEDNAIGVYNSLKDNIRKYLKVVLLKATLGPVVALLLFIGGLRALSALFGAEVDVSIIARFI